MAPGSNSTCSGRLKYPTSWIMVPSLSKKTAGLVVNDWLLTLIPRPVYIVFHVPPAGGYLKSQFLNTIARPFASLDILTLLT